VLAASAAQPTTNPRREGVINMLCFVPLMRAGLSPSNKESVPQNVKSLSCFDSRATVLSAAAGTCLQDERKK
jgi:hypothetical protein